MPPEIGPYSQDVLTRIYNVQWASGTVFVYGTLQGDLYRASFGDKTTAPEVRVVTKPVDDLGNTTADKLGDAAASYALVTNAVGEQVRTFLVTGERIEVKEIDDGAGNIITVRIPHPVICKSSNGLDWTKAYEDSATTNGVNLVWDQDAGETGLFYYDRSAGLKDEILSSPDGVTWSLVSSTNTDGDPAYRSTFPSFCTANDCFDARGQRVPDGVMRHDTATEVTMKPVLPPITFYEQGLHSFNISSDGTTHGGSLVDVTLPATDTTAAETVRVSIPGIQKVTCVAGVNGFWMAGGFVGQDIDAAGAVVFSVDDGATWNSLGTTPEGKPIGSTTAGVVTMIAATLGTG
jgi:hypothetical protein